MERTSLQLMRLASAPFASRGQAAPATPEESGEVVPVARGRDGGMGEGCIKNEQT